MLSLAESKIMSIAKRVKEPELFRKKQSTDSLHSFLIATIDLNHAGALSIF